MRNLKLNQIAVACAAALAAAPAFAVSNPTTVPGVQTIVMSGATAPDGFIKSAVEEMLKPGFFTYRNNDLGAAFQYRAWHGLAKAGIPGVAENTPILFVKRSRGGSVWGVNPVARAEKIQSLNFAGCTTGGAADGTTYSYFCPVTSADNPTTPPADGVVSDMGVSDVAPSLFKAPFNVEFGENELSAAEAARLTAKPVNTLMMGIVATSSVPATTRISRSDFGNMLMGNVQDWSQVDPSITTGNTQVVVCRRVDGSGTQASYNWYFNNFPCQSAFNGVAPPASMTTASVITGGSGTNADPFIVDPTAGYTVVNNSTSGDVRNCLIRAQTNVNHKILGDDGKWYQVNFAATPGTPFRAIGTLSVDSYNASGTGSGESTQWNFRMLDGAGTYVPGTDTASPGATGIAPSKANLLSGAYDFAVELTMQYRNVAVNGVPALAGVKKAFADELIKRSGDPAKIAVNAKSKAYAALPDLFDPTASAINAAHTALGSHQGNMCKPLIRKY